MLYTHKLTFWKVTSLKKLIKFWENVATVISADFEEPKNSIDETKSDLKRK